MQQKITGVVEANQMLAWDGPGAPGRSQHPLTPQTSNSTHPTDQNDNEQDLQEHVLLLRELKKTKILFTWEKNNMCQLHLS